MKERPILFSGPMVKAILEGRKTQTRRIVKPQPIRYKPISPPDMPGRWFYNNCGNGGLEMKCPFGAPGGGQLWVREKWASAVADGVPCICYAADLDRWYPPYGDDGFDYEKYKADYGNWASDLESGAEGRWKPSIHMPRWASRITLEITDVRVERLQGISEEDAKAEGLEFMEPDRFAVPGGKDWMPHDAAFQLLWDSINGPQSWAANPWVWVIAFKRIEPSP